MSVSHWNSVSNVKRWFGESFLTFKTKTFYSVLTQRRNKCFKNVSVLIGILIKGVQGPQNRDPHWSGSVTIDKRIQVKFKEEKNGSVFGFLENIR